MALCPECGKDTYSAVVTCPHCGYPLQSQAPAGDEMVRMAGFTTYMRSPVDSVNGYGVLTDRRFAFGTGKVLKKAAAGTPVNLEKPLAKGDIIIDIPRSDILTVTSGRQGLSTLFIIEANSGTFKFAVTKKAVHAEWEAAFREVLGK